MRGNPDSCGIWAPCLSYADGQFWLVYTDVKRYDGNFKDAPNYIVTAPTIEAEWSEPVYVNSSGFDPSLFHDDDGRKWFVNMQWNHRTESYGGSPKSPAFDGILLQEWDPAAKALKGPIKNIFAGSPLGLVEGPHLFKRNGWYYLTTAEGGTGYDHAVTMARSRNIDGPYEMHPNMHLITSKDHPGAVLQRAGHGQYVETPEGEAYHTHLCGRPLPPKRRCTLGRETALQKCVWRDDDWLYLENGTTVPDVDVPGLSGAVPVEKPMRSEYSFDGGTLPADFQWLRTPEPARIFNLTDRPGHLRLIARESIGSWFEQSLVARRQEHHSFRAETVVEFSPDTYQQVAGLTHYYNRHKFHAVAVTLHETLGRCVTILSCNGDYPNGTPELSRRKRRGDCRRWPRPARHGNPRERPAILLADRRQGRLAADRPGPRCRRDLRRGRTRRTRLLHRRFRRRVCLRYIGSGEGRGFRLVQLRRAVRDTLDPFHPQRATERARCGRNEKRKPAQGRLRRTRLNWGYWPVPSIS